MKNTDFDVAIVGGGLTGASLACALGHTELRVVVIEAVPFEADTQPSYDERRVALALGSQRIFEGIGVWQAIAARDATPIERIHISDRGYPGKARLSSADAGVRALGYVVPTRVIGAALLEFMDRCRNVSLHSPARVTDIDISSTHVNLCIEGKDGQSETSAGLAVVADGGRSDVRQRVGIATYHKDYGQVALVTTISSDRCHHGSAFERFTDSGPLALLPMSSQRYAVVWTLKPDDAEHALAWPDSEFTSRLQQAFGDLAGRFVRVGGRAVYPLSLVRARNPVRPRVAVIGNAAHAVHPVAGQGFNLGLRDVATLSEVLIRAAAVDRDVGSLDVLTEYATWRKRDERTITAFTDGLVRMFSNRFPPLVIARDLGLAAVDLCPPLKRALLRRTMGLAGRLPQLALGMRSH